MQKIIEDTLKKLYEDDDTFNYSIDQSVVIQSDIITKSFRYHYNNCEVYRKYCDFVNITPDMIQNENDFLKIPLIPSTMFKIQDIITGDRNNIVRVCTSSGTKGHVSNIYRDATTMDFFFKSICHNLKEYMDVKDLYCLNLGPTEKESKDLWIAYAINMLGRIYPIDNYIREGLS